MLGMRPLLRPTRSAGTPEQLGGAIPGRCLMPCDVVNPLNACGVFQGQGRKCARCGHPRACHTKEAS